MENGCDDQGERNRFVYKFEMKMLSDVFNQKKDIEKYKKRKINHTMDEKICVNNQVFKSGSDFYKSLSKKTK